MGYLYSKAGKSGEKIWHAMVTVDGKRKSTKVGVNYKNACKCLAKIESDLLLGKFDFFKKDCPTFATYAETFMQEAKVLGRRPKTLELYNTAFKHLKKVFNETPLNKITTEQVKKYQLARASVVSNRTINIECGVFKKILRCAVEEKLVEQGSIPKINLLKEVRKTPRFLSEGEIATLLQNASTFQRCYISILLGTGMRIGELLHLRFSQIDLNRRVIVLNPYDADGIVFQTKTGKARMVWLNEKSLMEFEFLKNNWIHPKNDKKKPRKPVQNGFVFCHADGSKIKCVRIAFDRLVKKCAFDPDKPKVTLHTLRHTACSHLLMSCNNLRIVQDFAGHASIKTTQRYTHVGNDIMAQAIKGLERLIPDFHEPFQKVA